MSSLDVPALEGIFPLKLLASGTFIDEKVVLRHNGILLHYLLASEPQSEEARGLSAKLDLALELFAQVLTTLQVSVLPPPQPISLTMDQLRWQDSGTGSVAYGQETFVQVFLAHPYPIPFTFVGDVIVEEKNRFLRYRLADEGVRTLLDKLIFREHRAQVHRERSQFSSL